MHLQHCGTDINLKKEIVMKATLKFRTDKATDWAVTKNFDNESHMDNFIGYICRTMGYTLDEVYFAPPRDAEERHWDGVATHNERFSGDDY